MACARCDYRGVIRIPPVEGKLSDGELKPCPFCKDTKAYYRYIKNKYSTTSINKKEILKFSKSKH